MDTPQTLPQRALWAVPRAVWLGAAAFGIAAVSAGAAMWLQPKLAGPEQLGTAVPAKASTTNAATNTAATKPAAKPVATAAACDHCGVVESVRTYQRKGEGSGVGAVAGGVLGAVVGNQVGKGNGRAAMTAIGAVGGGFAGNEIEKRTKSTTVTEVRVRMDDGTLRTFEPQQALRAGERVVVQGNAVHLAPAGG